MSEHQVGESHKATDEDVKAGATFHVLFPFARTEVDVLDADGPVTIMSWRPGVRFENVYPDDVESIADGLGEMLLTVVDVHKPGKFPARVFFTRQWRDPDGKSFGKGKLHIMTKQAFRRRTRGYAHDYTYTPSGSD